MMKILFLLLLLTANCLLTAQVENGLIANYSFNAQNTLDESGNTNDGTAFNLTAATDRFGNANKAYAFNGQDSYMSLPSSLLLTQDISISFWFKADSAKCAMLGHQNIAVSTSGPSQYVPIAYMRSDEKLNATLWNNTPGNTNNSTTEYSDGVWHHLVLSGNNTSHNIYIDGVNEGLGTAYTLLGSLTHGQFGTAFVSGGWPNGTNSGWSYFGGLMDDIRIYDRVLNITEIDTLFTLINPFVESISVKSAVATILISETLQMQATVLQATAEDTTYTWSVNNGTGSASISSAGVLTPTADGTVVVVATANDDSGVTGSKTITITDPTVGINDIKFEGLNLYPNPSTDIINLEISENLTAIKIIDLAGKTVKVFNPNTKQLNISEFTTGIYFLEIANAEKKSVIKLIKK